jgi:predicted RNase H-like HicB family nuclease
MDEKLWQEAKRLAARNYRTLVAQEKLSNGNIVYIAKNPALFGCMAQGATIEEAIENLNEARIDYIYDSLENDIAIPTPETITIHASNTFVVVDQTQFKIQRMVNCESNVENFV